MLSQEGTTKKSLIIMNYVCDYIMAETEKEAIEMYKTWLVENGCDPEEVERYEYQVKEIEK